MHIFLPYTLLGSSLDALVLGVLMRWNHLLLRIRSLELVYYAGHFFRRAGNRLGNNPGKTVATG